MKRLFCKHNWTHKNYSTFSVDTTSENEKVVVADVYQIKECTKCGKLYKGVLYTRCLHTLDDISDFVVGECTD